MISREMRWDEMLVSERLRASERRGVKFLLHVVFYSPSGNAELVLFTVWFVVWFGLDWLCSRCRYACWYPMLMLLCLYNPSDEGTGAGISSLSLGYSSLFTICQCWAVVVQWQSFYAIICLNVSRQFTNYHIRGILQDVDSRFFPCSHLITEIFNLWLSVRKT